MYFIDGINRGFLIYRMDRRTQMEKPMSNKSTAPVKTQSAAAAAGFGKKGLCYNKT
jgi:hypothetical protein